METAARSTGADRVRAGSAALLMARATRELLVLLMAVALLALHAGPGHADDRAMVPSASAAWRDRLVTALRAIEEEDYTRGLDILQKAMETGDRVLVAAPAELGRSLPEIRAALETVVSRPAIARVDRRRGLGRRFLELQTLARVLLCQLPGGAIDAYRARYDDIGTRLLERYSSSGDRGALRRLAGSYFVTSGGAIARELEGDRHLEDGRAREAYFHYRAVLQDCPRPAVDRVHLSIKLLLCLRLMGDEGLYRLHRGEVLEAIAAGRAGKSPRISGRAKFRDALRSLEREVPLVPLAERPPERGASTWGGELPLRVLPELPGSLLGLSWEGWVWSDRHRIVENDPDAALDEPRVGRPGRFRSFGYDYGGIEYPFVPLVDGDEIWISSVFHFYRLDGRPGTGSALEERSKPDPERVKQSHFKEKSDTTIYALTLWKKKWERSPGSLARLPEEVLIGHYVSTGVEFSRFMGYDVSIDIPVRSLVAFDPRGGEKLLWRTLPRDPKKMPADSLARLDAARREKIRAQREPESSRAPGPRDRMVGPRELYGPQEIPADICYTSPVVVRGGVVYAAGWNQRGFVNSVVRALDLASGKTLWETLISSTQMEMTMFGEIAREPFVSFLTERDGIIYCQTNLGAVAALEAESGKILWLTTYDTIPVEPAMGHVAPRRWLPWGVNPSLLVGHVLIVAPRDSKHLYAIDTGRGPGGAAAGGRILWTYRNATGDIRDLLGLYRQRLYFTGRAGVAYLDLSDLTPSGELASRRSPRLELAAGSWGRDRIPARGALTRSGVVFADADRLWLVDLDLKTRRPLLPESFPKSEHGQYAGSVRIGRDMVLVTSRQILSAFTPVTR